MQKFERVIQFARINGQRAWLELLRDREEWNSTPHWAQDEAIKAVSEQLADQLTFRNTQIYECGGQRHRIAQFLHRATNITLNLLPGGPFEMGGEGLYEKPVHPVRVRPFLVGVTRVTEAQWGKFGVRGIRGYKGESRSITNVSWRDIKAWLAPPKIVGGLALPTESEWEYFCRAGTTTATCYGDDEAIVRGNAAFGQLRHEPPQPAEDRRPNAFGLYGFDEGLYEWCQDSWHANYSGAPVDGSAWLIEDKASDRVVRGSGSPHRSRGCRSAGRFRRSATNRFFLHGFRLCLRLD